MFIPSMLLTTCTWEEKFESFQLIPILNDCPYTEAFYDPELKVLVLFTKEKKEHFSMIPRIDQFGEEIRKNKKMLVDRQKVTAPNEYYIDRPEEIREFLKMFAINAENYNYEKYLEGVIEIPVIGRFSNKKLSTASL